MNLLNQNISDIIPFSSKGTTSFLGTTTNIKTLWGY
jgi:hypothetical protein